MNTIEFTEKLADMWSDSRYKAGKSQEYMAKALGVSKKTIQNWEAGLASPNLRTAFEWFEAIGVPMYPYIMELLYPDVISGISHDSDMIELRKALHTYIDELDDFHARELLYILYGSHGSSPTGTIDVMTAYLHLPLLMRICITDNILTNFDMAEKLNLVRDDEHVLPQIETIKKHVKSAKNAVVNGKESYTITEKEDDAE